MRRVLLFLPLLAGFALAQPPTAPAPRNAAPSRPWFIDDEKFLDDFMAKLTGLASDGKCLAQEKLSERTKRPKKVRFTPGKPSTTPLTPEEIYKKALPSVFLIGSVHKDKDGDWVDGLYATAWVVGAEGILVTNWHVFTELEDCEVFGAVDHKGKVYPLVEFLGGDPVADVAVVRIDAKDLPPLPLASEFAEIGSWVGVLGHPGDNFYVFTQGHVTRYSTNRTEEGKRERWMGLSAEYAGGSSGSPVLNKYGAVVGMAAITITIGDDHVVVPSAGKRKAVLGRLARTMKNQPPLAPPPRELPGGMPAPPQNGAVQMIVKMAVPGPTILRTFGK